MVLTLLDESSSSCGTATQHIMLTSVATDSASENSGDSGSASSEDSRFLPPVQLPLSALPSVQAVCEGHRLMFTSKFHDQTEESTLNFSDWRDLAKTYGTDCFLAVPLSFAQLDMGTLLLMSDKPAALDKHVRKLVIELGLVVAQTLYTLLCMQQMRAGDCIINDILPEKVRPCSQCGLCLLLAASLLHETAMCCIKYCCRCLAWVGWDLTTVLDIGSAYLPEEPSFTAGCINMTSNFFLA